MKRLLLSDFSGSTVVDVVNNPPNSENCENFKIRHILDRIIQILKNGKSLTFVRIVDDNLKLDSDILLDTILNSARGQTLVVSSVSYPKISISLARLVHTDLSKSLVLESSNVSEPRPPDTSYTSWSFQFFIIHLF